jgi:hypothetical protein
MNIESAIYNIDKETRETVNIMAVIDGRKSFVPLDSGNRHYIAIMEKVETGALTVEPEYTEQELDQMEAEAQAQAEAKAQLRTSVINKIATNLTSEEKLWLEENL